MSQLIHSHQLPSAIQRKLQIVRRHLILLVAARGLAIAASVLIAAMIAAMTIDWLWTLFDPLARSILTLSTLAFAIGALAITVLGPMTRAMRQSHAARLVDAAVPQLQQRWSTVTGLAYSANAPTTPASRLMLEQVTSEAVAMHSMVEPWRVASTASVRPAVLGLVACLVGLSAFLASHWGQTSVLLRRFWSPTQNVTATQLITVTGDRLVPRGEPVELITRQTGLPRQSAELTVRYPSGSEDVFEVAQDQNAPDRFAHTMRVDESMRYRVRAGDGQTEWHELRVIDFPDIDELRFTATAPAYSQRSIVEKDHLPRRLKVLEGTQLTLMIKPQQRLRRMVMIAAKPSLEGSDDQPVLSEMNVSADADGWYRYDTTVSADLILRPTLWSPHGLRNQTKLFCRIEVVADKPPVARVIRPTDEMAVAVDEVLDIEFEAHDDHGIATAELVVYDDSAKDENGRPRVIATQAIPLGDQRLLKHLAGKTQLNLKELELQNGASISYAIRVTDNRQLPLAGTATTPLESEERSPAQGSTTDPGAATDQRNAGSNALAFEARREAEDVLDIRSGDRSPAPTDEQDVPATFERAVEHETQENTLGASKPASKNEVTSKDRSVVTELANSTAKANDAPASRQPAKDILGDQASAATVQEPEVMKPKPSTTGLGKSKSNAAAPPNAAPSSDEAGAPVADLAAMSRPQQSESGQNTETSRQRLKITKRLSAIAASDARVIENADIRDRVVAIDAMLAQTQAALERLVTREIPDAQRGEQFQLLDSQIGDVESFVAELRNQTKENEFAFVGLQMVDIGRTYITPARDRVFGGIRNPNASDVGTKVALGHILRARELLTALLKRYDSVKQDRDLSQSLAETVTMYEVYVGKRQQLMREARQNRNPLERKMGIVEVDQEYLDRYKEVLTLRREMMEELASLLGDDPRLLSRYLDLVNSRQRSLRDQLSELTERQDEAAAELSSWLEIDEEQKDDLWMILIELRMQSANRLASDAAELAERVEKQMPLEVDPEQGTPSIVIARSKAIAATARSVAMTADELIASGEDLPDSSALRQQAEMLTLLFAALDASLDRLQFEYEGTPEVSAYVQPRLLESRTVADQAEAWVIFVGNLVERSYDSIVSVEQQRMAVASELLRSEMLGIEADLEGQFQRQTPTAVPGEIIDQVRQLHRLMESITFNQAAASYAAGRRDLPRAAKQQQLALERFGQAEKLFDRMRRSVADALDAYPPPNPNITDLRDPTLDAFLAQLEREPNIAAQLGIPNRPRNLRVIEDSMLWQQSGGDLLGSSGDAAMRRAREAMRMQANGNGKRKELPDQDSSEPVILDEDLTDEERQQLAAAKKAQETLESSLLAIEKQMTDKETKAPQRRQLGELAENIKRMLQQTKDDSSAIQAWKQIAQYDQAQNALAAVARGDAIPDQQWNRLLSTLEDGLWQVQGKRPPEQYRKAIQQYQDQIRELTTTVDGG